jgi:60 kDa SS-A/Ro ribonucleoprotein
MTTSIYSKFNTRQTPQTEAIPGQVQIRNSAGGYGYELPALKVLERFLILGSEGGTYYASEQKLTKDNALSIIKLFESEDAIAGVDLIVQISDSGRAPKNDPSTLRTCSCRFFSESSGSGARSR